MTLSPLIVAVNLIAVLGDSLAISPTRADGFPSVLKERLEDHALDWQVSNYGIRGDTTTGGLRRLDVVLRDNPTVLILALGANDGLRGVPVATVKHDLSEIITRAKARGVRVLLCGMETPPLRGWSYTLAFHNVFPELAREHDVPLVPFLLAGVALDPEMNLEDMIHPNRTGAKRIADTVWPFLRPLLTAPSAPLLRK
jgi:acyl-CoA thioesterase-1